MVGLNYIIDNIKLWIEALCYPVYSTTKLLSEIETSKSLSNVLNLWIISFILSIIIYEPILNLFGISWANVEAHASFLIIFLFHILINASIIHICLRLFGLQSDLRQTIAAYTIVVIYTPILEIFYLPANYYLYSSMHILKDAKILFDNFNLDTFKAVANEAKKIQDKQPLSTAIAVGNYIELLIDTALLAGFSEMIYQWYGNPRYKTYLAVSAGWLLSLFSGVSLIVLFKLWAIYNFIE